jgi:hypothetical protein
MDPASLIPTADTLPVAWPWLKAFLIPCFVVHLLFMNALVGTGVIGWAQAMRSDASSLQTAGGIGKKLPFFMAFAINFGVAALLFLQVLYGHFFYTSSILMAVIWLSALALILGAYAAAYWIDFRPPESGSMRRLVWTMMVAALLMVAFIFVNNLTLMQDPAAWVGYFRNPNGTLWHWNDPGLIPRYLHFTTASVAVGGLVLALLNQRRGLDPAGNMNWFTAATAIQLLVGGWFLLSLKPAVRLALMGGNPMATGFFGAALIGVLSALACGLKQWVRPAAGAVLFTVTAMVLVRDSVRSLYLAPYFSPDILSVHPQYAPMIVFSLFVCLGIAAVTYLVRLYGQK